MIEIPESVTLAKQLNDTITGKVIKSACADSSPHKFAWYFGEPHNYNDLLAGKRIDRAESYGGMVEIQAGETRILFCDGVNIRYFEPGEKLPAKHQLFIEFDDSSSLVCSVQMYGGLWAFVEGQNDNPYYISSKTKPSPLTEAFDERHFNELLQSLKSKSLSVKAFLATEQRIKGLGNGVLQDILFNAGIHPKRKINTLSPEEVNKLYHSVKSTLSNMVAMGGRDTEKDLFGANGGYKTILSKNTAGKPCPVCGTLIKKEAYLGGSIYYCEHCQPV